MDDTRACWTIIFDLDGALCHTDQYHYKAWRTLADEYGIPFDRQDNNRLRGVSRMESLDIILERYSGDIARLPKQEMADKKNQTYRSLLSRMRPEDIRPEVLGALKRLKDSGFSLAVGSSSKNAPLILERTGLTEWFDAVIDGNQITRSKPDPEVFLKAADAVGIPPDHCIVVEDAKAGILAAQAGGMVTIAIGDAADSIDADYAISQIDEVYDIVVKESFR